MLLLLLLLFLNANVLINVTTIPSNVDKSSTSLLLLNGRFRTLRNPPPSKLIVPINDSMELEFMKLNDPELCPPITPSTCAYHEFVCHVGSASRISSSAVAIAAAADSTK